MKTDGEATERVFKTQDEAVDAAKQSLRKSGGGEVVIHRRDGRIRDLDTVGKGAHGRDVKLPPRGGRLSRSEVRDAVWNGSKAIRAK